MVKQKEKNDKFEMMINSTDEAYINVTKDKLTYSNVISKRIFDTDLQLPHFVKKPYFFIFKGNNADEEEE